PRHLHSFPTRRSSDLARDWVYVGDLCRGIDSVLHADIDTVKGQVINLGSGRDTQVRDIATMIVDKMGKSRALLTSIGDRPGQVADRKSARLNSSHVSI